MKIPKHYMERFTGIIGNQLIINTDQPLTSRQKANTYKTAGTGFYCKSGGQYIL